MKKNILFLIAVFMLSIVATPVAAQSRKDKKAAKKAEWEMEQQRKKEEAELLHQMRMDSIRAVKEAKEYQREREQRLEAEREADRQAEKREQEYLRSQEANYAPCYEADTEEYFTGHQQRLMPLSYVSTQATSLLRSAQQQLRQKIKFVSCFLDYMILIIKKNIPLYLKICKDTPFMCNYKGIT